MKILFKPLLVVLTGALTACATVDRDGGKALGTAGQSTATALATQVDQAKKTIDSLPEWQGVHDILVCVNVRAQLQAECLDKARNKASPGNMDPKLATSYKSLSAVMEKRSKAIGTLGDAYKAFVDLSTYDAGDAAAKAVDGLFSSVNDLSTAAAAIAPAGILLAPITATFSKVGAGIAALSADARQAKAMKTASHDLSVASVALAKALKVERDKIASESLFEVLQAERDQLYARFVEVGAVSAIEVLKPLFLEVAPDSGPLQKPPDKNADIVAAAAVASLNQRSRRQQALTVRAYDASLASLDKLAAQHQKFEEDYPLDIGSIQAEVKRLEDILKSIDKIK